MKKLFLALMVAMGSALASFAAKAEDISCVSTTFRFLGPNDKVCVSVFDDPKVPGVACHISKRTSVFFKRTHVYRIPDKKRNTLVYLVISDRLIDGSPQNSISTVPIIPWKAAE
ncbi:MAG: CreA family protein [Alphaproteobacteria bacterium]